MEAVIKPHVDWYTKKERDTKKERYQLLEGMFRLETALHRQPREALDSHTAELGLRSLSHHEVGRHSVASQAVSSGQSAKAVQAQIRHRSEQSVEARTRPSTRPCSPRATATRWQRPFRVRETASSPPPP
jgi:hypothetical protein